MISEDTLNKLEEVLIEVVNGRDSGTWREAKEQIENSLSEEGKSALEEFTGWFETE